MCACAQKQHQPAQSFKQRGTIVISRGIAWLYLQGACVVRYSSVISPQPVIRERPVVEGSAMPWIQLDRSRVILEGFVKPSLLTQGIVQSVY